MKEMQDRIDDYLDFGVSYVWLLHPRTRRAFVYTRDAVHEVKDGTLRTESPALCVPLAELESEQKNGEPPEDGARRFLLAESHTSRKLGTVSFPLI